MCVVGSAQICTLKSYDSCVVPLSGKYSCFILQLHNSKAVATGSMKRINGNNNSLLAKCKDNS
jgi:hypothetical protein